MRKLELKRERQPLSLLKRKLQTTDAEEVVERTAKEILYAGIKFFLVLFSIGFGAIISSDFIEGEWGNTVLVTSVLILAAIFLYYHVKGRKEIAVHIKDKQAMARVQTKIAEETSAFFKKEMEKTARHLEGLYADTITGLTCQINDLILLMCEEREKLETLLTVMTTESINGNGIEDMTTEG